MRGGLLASSRGRFMRPFMTPNLTQNRVLHYVPSFTTVLAASSLLRIALILYSEWHDAHSVVKYTDIDYRVFSDAARFVLHPSAENRAQGPLGEFLGLGECVQVPPFCENVACLTRRWMVLQSVHEGDV